MTAERGDDAVVRIHVGGLARGVDPKELAALIARALPSGASPTAEIMRDASTGIERGFGYVSVAGGEGVRAGAERAIAAYNGTRWRGNKIRVGFAKGDYLQRLKAEWGEAAKAKEAAAAAAAVAAAAAAASRKPSVTAPYKARPSLRLRRRPGERIILVDPTPIAWTKPPRQDAKSWNKAKEKEAKEKEERERQGGDGEGGDEGGPHRRKRGVLGCRRRVEFPGRAATCSTKCRELWRKHLQEQAAEASAARQRSVDRFMSGKHAGAVAATVDAPNGATSPRAEAMEEQDAAEYLPVEDAADLVPEEPPAAEGIEFVWDDAAEDAAGSGSDGAGEDDESGDGGSAQDGEQGTQEHGYHVPAPAAGLEGQADQGEAGESEADEAPDVDSWGDGVADIDGRAPLQTSEVWGGAPAGRAPSKKLERLGNKHGLELDDRLAELLSDGSDDDDEEAHGDGGFDYELETAKRAGIAAAKAAVDEPVEGMRDRLQAETERSLGVLADLFGGDGAAPARPTGETSGASSDSVPAPESGMAGVDDVGDAKAASTSVSNTKETGDGVAASTSVSNTKETGDGVGGGVVLPKPSEQQQPAPLGDGETPLPGAGITPAVQERFVAHMPKLTDIFTVQDKVSTKKSREEKEKDKGFKVTSLFGGLVGGEGPKPAAGPEATASGFSFAFGGGAVGLPGAPTDDGEGAMTVSRDSEQAPPAQHSPGLHPASVPADGQSTQPQPGTIPPSPGDAPDGTDTALWRPLGDIVAVGARFVRIGGRENVEAAWLGERRALTQDFKRKHKDAVKGRRGAGGGGAALKKRKRR